MKRLVVIPLAALVLALGACGKVAHVTSNPQAKQQVTHDEAVAKLILAKCGVSTTTITVAEVQKFRNPAGRRAVATCVAPPGHQAQFEACSLNSVKASVTIRGINAPKLSGALTQCVVVNR